MRIYCNIIALSFQIARKGNMQDLPMIYMSPGLHMKKGVITNIQKRDIIEEKM